MAKKIAPAAADLAEQIQAFEARRPRYETYACALERVLKAACRRHLPEAIVTARAKDVPSFAGKVVRKFGNYSDAVNQMNDLCGARVIVQTLSQVEDVRHFVDHNFDVVETEDISQRLGGREFGYRDRHYIVQLKRERAAVIGFTPEEIAEIEGLRAELQIRTWAQHAWADTLHDRTYKTAIRPTAETDRTAALLAALMEEGDRNFDRLANHLDQLVDNYAAYHDRAAVEAEIARDELVCQELRKRETPPPSGSLVAAGAAPVSTTAYRPDDRSWLALKLARLHTALGRHEQAVALLEPYADTDATLREELLLELGTALCRRDRLTPNSEAYQRGRRLIAGVEQKLAAQQPSEVWNLRRRSSLRARALSRLGWAYEADEGASARASQAHRDALQLEPANPYYLADVLSYELRGGARTDEVVRCLRPGLEQAVRTCERHAEQGLEFPFAWFTAGRLRLLLDQPEQAFHDYLRGAHHCLDAQSCVGCELLDEEVRWLHRVCPGRALPAGFERAKEFLLLTKTARDCAACVRTGKPSGVQSAPRPHLEIRGPVIILAGGAGSLDRSVCEQLRQPLMDALRQFEGTVISGGTRSGLPGLAGEIAEALKNQPQGRPFKLVGYRPRLLPDDAPPDPRYDECAIVGERGFGPEQILANWADILAAGIPPEQVRLLGVGGGTVAAVEYRMALAMGACVGILDFRKGTASVRDAADRLLGDPQWVDFPNLLPLPVDTATLRAFLNHRSSGRSMKQLTRKRVVLMARDFHASYQRNNQEKLPENLRPWHQLPRGYKRSNYAQAAYAVEILKAAGFGVRDHSDAADAIRSFDSKEFAAAMELMAELEHGRWNIERLKEGWRPGKTRDNDRRINPCITPWSDEGVLQQKIKDYDRQAVRLFPKLLAQAGLEIVRPSGSDETSTSADSTPQAPGHE